MVKIGLRGSRMQKSFAFDLLVVCAGVPLKDTPSAINPAQMLGGPAKITVMKC
jgi:hypothetical protein